MSPTSNLEQEERPTADAGWKDKDAKTARIKEREEQKMAAKQRTTQLASLTTLPNGESL